MIADMGAFVLRSISHVYDVHLKLSLFSSTYRHGNQDREARLYILYARAIREKVPFGIHKVGV